MISDSNQSKSNQNDEIRVLEPHSSNKFPLSNRETEVDNGAIISEPYLKTDNLFVWLVGSTIFTLPYDAIEEYLICDTPVA